METEYRVYKGKRVRSQNVTLSIEDKNRLLSEGCFLIVATEDKKNDQHKMEKIFNEKSRTDQYSKDDYPNLYAIGSSFNYTNDGKIRKRYQHN
jgi:hypothetical protein